MRHFLTLLKQLGHEAGAESGYDFFFDILGNQGRHKSLNTPQSPKTSAGDVGALLLRKDLTILPGMPGHETRESGPLPSTDSLSSVGYINSSVTLPGSVKKGIPPSAPAAGKDSSSLTRPQEWTHRVTLARTTVAIAALLVLLASGLALVEPAEANTGCPGSTTSLGQIALSGTCTVDTDTTWENGTITIAGDVVVNSGVTLSMNAVDILFDPGVDREFGVVVYGTLTMQGGGAESTNTNRWDFVTGSGSTVTIDGSDFANGMYDFSSSIADIGNSVFHDTDSTDAQHLWVGASSDFHDNLLHNISLTADAAIVVWKNWGDTRIWGNELHLECYGNNCMGIEVINMHSSLTSLYPGFPVVEVAWNSVTWEVIASGTDSAALDHEYSMRLYVHNNTQYVNPLGLASGEAVTEPLEMGGPLDSIFENNTFYGPSKFGIYHYIYTDASNVVQNNRFYDVQWGGIFQTGGNTYRRNEFINVTDAGIWICPNAPCAGFDAGVANNSWYDNSFTYVPGATLADADAGNMFDNILIHHGNGQVNQWEGGGFHTVYGDGSWLYWANEDIESLQFVNTTGGTRYVNMTVGGVVYPSSYPGFGTTDDASLTIAGALDRTGSSNYDDTQRSTVLWSLSPGRTQVDVLATGSLVFTVDNFAASWSYNVSVWDYGLSQLANQAFTTDTSGRGNFNIASAGHYQVTMDAAGTPLPPPPTDGTAPAGVTDLVVAGASTDYAILQWTAPGDDGSLGQASDYDIRYSTAGPMDEADFAGATPVPVGVPSPGPSGTPETLNVTGLSPGTEYWFALRTADEVPNWSPVSNNVNVTTSPPPDVSSPAQVTDLEAVAVNSDYVVLQWRAPGDDGGVGRADAYDVRYSTTGPLGEVNFGNATPVPVSVPAPVGAGGIERLNVTGLAPATDYWFALRTSDEVPNWSPASNVVNATTLQNATSIDDTPPTVTITSPDQDAMVVGTVVVTVEASDDTSVVEVTILLDGALATTLTESPYAWAWSTETSALGLHTLTAEATDPAGNVGSDEVQVTVLPPGITPETTRPTVVSLVYDPSESRFDIQFSRPMDRASVSQALSVEPRIAYQTTWADDSNLTVVLQEASQPDLAYTLTIAASAVDTEGTPLTEAFAFGFIGIGVMEDTAVVPDVWLRVSLLLAAGLVTVAGLYLWSRRSTQRVRHGMRQLASRLEELNSASQARIYQELADLEGLISETKNTTDRRATPLSRGR